MKKLIITSIVCMALLFSSRAMAQFTFSVSPGLHLNGASFGYRVNNLVPFVSFQVLGGATEMSEKGRRYDPGVGDIVSYEDKFSTSITAYIPVIGAKYLFGKSEKIRPYGTACFTKVILSGKAEDNNDPTVKEEFEKNLKETRLYGGQFGFGTEYFMDKNFSFGGEFGFRFISGSNTNTEQVDIYNPNTGNYESSTITTESKLKISPTYVKLSLNFYFGN